MNPDTREVLRLLRMGLNMDEINTLSKEFGPWYQSFMSANREENK